MPKVYARTGDIEFSMDVKNPKEWKQAIKDMRMVFKEEKKKKKQDYNNKVVIINHGLYNFINGMRLHQESWEAALTRALNGERPKDELLVSEAKKMEIRLKKESLAEIRSLAQTAKILERNLR